LSEREIYHPAADPDNRPPSSACGRDYSGKCRDSAGRCGAVAAFVANGNNPPAGLFLVGDGPTVGPKQ
jgi:hypothetical protein